MVFFYKSPKGFKVRLPFLFNMWYKKGGMTEEQLFFMADLVFLVIISLVLISYLGTIQKDTSFERNYVARDLGLMINTIQTLAGDGTIEYGLPLSLEIELASEEIIVSDGAMSSIKYHFSKISKIIPAKISGKIVTLKKIGNEVTIS